jgi:hypothetical protein
MFWLNAYKISIAIAFIIATILFVIGGIVVIIYSIDIFDINPFLVTIIGFLIIAACEFVLFLILAFTNSIVHAIETTAAIKDDTYKISKSIEALALSGKGEDTFEME